MKIANKTQINFNMTTHFILIEQCSNGNGALYGIDGGLKWNWYDNIIDQIEDVRLLFLFKYNSVRYGAWPTLTFFDVPIITQCRYQICM